MLSQSRIVFLLHSISKQNRPIEAATNYYFPPTLLSFLYEWQSIVVVPVNVAPVLNSTAQQSSLQFEIKFSVAYLINVLWVRYSCLTPSEQSFRSIIMARTSYIRWWYPLLTEPTFICIFCLYLIREALESDPRLTTFKKTLFRDYLNERLHVRWFVSLMVFNATFNNISAISWRSVYCGGNQSIRRKPPACRKSLTIFIT